MDSESVKDCHSDSNTPKSTLSSKLKIDDSVVCLRFGGSLRQSICMVYMADSNYNYSTVFSNNRGYKGLPYKWRKGNVQCLQSEWNGSRQYSSHPVSLSKVNYIYCNVITIMCIFRAVVRGILIQVLLCKNREV